MPRSSLGLGSVTVNVPDRLWDSRKSDWLVRKFKIPKPPRLVGSQTLTLIIPKPLTLGKLLLLKSQFSHLRFPSLASPPFVSFLFVRKLRQSPVLGFASIFSISGARLRKKAWIITLASKNFYLQHTHLHCFYHNRHELVNSLSLWLSLPPQESKRVLKSKPVNRFHFDPNLFKLADFTPKSSGYIQKYSSI